VSKRAFSPLRIRSWSSAMRIRSDFMAALPSGRASVLLFFSGTAALDAEEAIASHLFLEFRWLKSLRSIFRARYPRTGIGPLRRDFTQASRAFYIAEPGRNRCGDGNSCPLPTKAAQVLF